MVAPWNTGGFSQWGAQPGSMGGLGGIPGATNMGNNVFVSSNPVTNVAGSTANLNPMAAPWQPPAAPSTPAPVTPGGGSFSTGAGNPVMDQAPRWGSPLARDAPYPVRQFSPQSAMVDNPLAGMGSMQDWETDWQNRYNAEEARRGQGATGPRALGPERDQFIVNELRNLGAPINSTTLGAFGIGNMGSFSDQGHGDYAANVAGLGNMGQNVVANSIGRDNFDRLMGYQQQFDPGNAGYTPDFSALNAERDKFQPLWENQQRQQQSFNMMEGQGQRFGMMGPDYTSPGFGQVSGQVNPFAPEMGAGRAAVQGANDGIDTDWLTGVYDPRTMQAAGVYRPGGLGGLGGMR